VETLGINDGTFQVNATIAPAVRVRLNAKLYGTGNILGPVTTTSNGVISPGVAIGAATGILSTGSLSLAATSSYQVQLNGLVDGAEHDVLNVTGTVNLGGANLDATTGFTAIPGDEIMILHNAGVAPVLNKFAQGDLITIGAQKFAIDYQYDGDNDGMNNDVALIRYGAALAPDPCDPTKMALFVSATTGDDVVRFISVKGNNLIHVLINTDDFGNFAPTGLLIGFGQAGNDKVTVEVPSRAAWLYGQAGNDLLITGNNDSVLIGGNDNDHLIAGNGKDVLIGGKGADLLEGGNGDDLLIAGSTAFDTNNAPHRKAICAIDDEWTRGTGGWKGHIDHLTNGGGLNGAVLLNAATVFDDADVDVVLGQNGKDWLLSNTSGGSALDLTDATKDEIVTDL
jgi:Ca2+-binding RTX toxin-like protein